MANSQDVARRSLLLLAALAVAGVLIGGLVLQNVLSGSDGDSAFTHALVGEGSLAGSTAFTAPFLTVEGNHRTVDDYLGDTPLVINFFASWCPPCRAEMPDFEAAKQAHPGVTFLGISHDLDETSWQSFVADAGVTFETVYQPEQATFSALEATAMPTTILVQPDGTVADFHAGPLNRAQLDELIADHFSPDSQRKATS